METHAPLWDRSASLWGAPQWEELARIHSDAAPLWEWRAPWRRTRRYGTEVRPYGARTIVGRIDAHP